MNRLIVLLRHGESADKQPKQSDFDRILTQRGLESIQRLGMLLLQEKIFPKTIFSSSAIRARRTTETILNTMRVSNASVTYDRELYEGSEHTYLDFIAIMDSSIDVSMLVGHNPSISSLVGLLTGQHSVALHPGQAALIELSALSKSPSGRLIQLIGPFL